MLEKTRYLGDGLYVHYNGVAYEIRVNNHKNPTVAYFESHHIKKLNTFKNEWEKMKKPGTTNQDPKNMKDGI